MTTLTASYLKGQFNERSQSGNGVALSYHHQKRPEKTKSLIYMIY